MTFERHTGEIMADIFNFVEQSANTRPKYTSYEIIYMIKEKQLSKEILKEVLKMPIRYFFSCNKA